MNYKDTLHLPKTNFPLNLNREAEQTRYAEWHKTGFYAFLKGNKNKADFVLHDGPPYANGDIHVGHALNKILKDFIVKYHAFRGMAVEFRPGWDCHGLPIEQKVKNLGDNPLEIRANCRAYALEQVDRQREQFKTLGVMADWENPYLTLSPEFELNTYKCIVRLLEKGLLYSLSKPVFWSWKAGTALAEAEVEYKDIKTESAYVCFPVVDAGKEFTTGKPTYLLIWTTTPWTLPANEMIAAGKCLYGLCEWTENKYVLVAENRIDELQKKNIVGNLIEMVKWETLEKLEFGSPLHDTRTSQLVFSNIVEDKGTGFVHIAPGHGVEDYYIALNNHLDRFAMPVGPDGKYTTDVELTVNPQMDNLLNLTGVHVFDGNKKIIEYLKKNNLCKTETIEHSYPYCSRTETPIIFRATEQWFLKLGALQADAVKSLQYVKFDTKDRLLEMIKNRPDWCVSRQRTWGVPLAFLKHKQNGNILCNFNQITKVFEEKGVDAWWSEPIETFLPEGESAENYDKVMDVLDVWFDSGLTWTTLVGDGGDWWTQKADLYLEGNDQHRGWFQSSLWLSIALQGIAPYDDVVCHGFVVDGNGQKMAKSKGNVIAPQDVIKNYGSEVLRYWVAMTDYTKEIRLNKEILNRALEGYKKLRNTLRFLIANMDETTPAHFENLCVEDHWMLVEFENIERTVDLHFHRYEFYLGMNKLVEFVNSKLSNVYMNMAKDRLYCDAKDSQRRLSTLFVTNKIFNGMVRLLAPILTYTVDEAVRNYSGQGLENYDFAPPVEQADNNFDGKYWLEALNQFHAAFNHLKEQGAAKDTLEVLIDTSESSKELFDNLEDWFVVGGIGTGERLASFNVGTDIYYVVKSSKNKCQRCWKRNAETELCNRCQNVTLHSQKS